MAHPFCNREAIKNTLKDKMKNLGFIFIPNVTMSETPPPRPSAMQTEKPKRKLTPVGTSPSITFQKEGTERKFTSWVDVEAFTRAKATS